MLSDVTNKDSLEALYDEICETMPPVAGVAQGASKFMFPSNKILRVISQISDITPSSGVR